METEVEKLKRRLVEMGAKNFNVSIVEGATVEDVAREVNRALDALENGDYEEINFNDEEENLIDED